MMEDLIHMKECKDKELSGVVAAIDHAVKKGNNLFDFEKILKSSGFKKVTTSTSPVGHVRITGVGSKDILIFSKKYVDKGDRPTLIGPYAIDREG